MHQMPASSHVTGMLHLQLIVGHTAHVLARPKCYLPDHPTTQQPETGTSPAAIVSLTAWLAHSLSIYTIIVIHTNFQGARTRERGGEGGPVQGGRATPHEPTEAARHASTAQRANNILPTLAHTHTREYARARTHTHAHTSRSTLGKAAGCPLRESPRSQSGHESSQTRPAASYASDTPMYTDARRSSATKHRSRTWLIRSC